MKLSLFFPILCVTAATLLPSLAEEDQQSEWKSLFDGKSLSGWEGMPKYWSVEDGVITAQSDEIIPSNTFLIYQGGEFSNFELIFDARIFSGNSGVQFRSHQVEPPKDHLPFQVEGYQADFDSLNKWSGTLYHQGRGILAKRGTRTTMTDAKDPLRSAQIDDPEKLATHIHPIGEWNSYKVIVIGNRLTYYINGTLMSETTDTGLTQSATSGIIALQLHRTKKTGMKVQFKHIKIKELSQ